jgi:hypothetical protein
VLSPGQVRNGSFSLFEGLSVLEHVGIFFERVKNDSFFPISYLKNKITNWHLFFDFTSKNQKKDANSKYFLVASGEKGLLRPSRPT